MHPVPALPPKLIIRAELVNPPTWFSSFRDLTLYSSIFLKLDVLLEAEDVDPYYHWLRPRGGMDFVEDFVRPASETGLRIDCEDRFKEFVAIIVERIAPENIHSIISKIKRSYSMS